MLPTTRRFVVTGLPETENSSGSFYDLAIVARIEAEPVNLATTYIGDRVQINAIYIEDGQVVLDMITHGPEDPMCCPTQHVIQQFALQDGQLVMTETEFLLS